LEKKLAYAARWTKGTKNSREVRAKKKAPEGLLEYEALRGPINSQNEEKGH